MVALFDRELRLTMGEGEGPRDLSAARSTFIGKPPGGALAAAPQAAARLAAAFAATIDGEPRRLEIDALGGYSGIVSDRSAIQFRMLNRSKGPAMWSPRTQNDRLAFAVEWRSMLEATQNVDFFQDMVHGLLINNRGEISGVKTGLGIEIRAKAVILTSGTFMNGLIHIGEKNFGGGRAGEKASFGITEQLVDLGFEHGRMKTGTPPRLDGRSLDYSKMEIQHGDTDPGKFSFADTVPVQDQLPCHITYTNPEVHDILREGFDRSPMFNGRIKSVGPRYCPSIEDKIDRFSDRDRHQLFVEPEGRNTVEIYLNGFSSSLPEEIQLSALRKIAGLEKAKMFRPGYAIEYDYFPPTQLKHSLETKPIRNLFFAGQINGTTGYEEAACQGLIAGINAHQNISGRDPFILGRSEAYIGVLIDDLITKGTKEPYRMFTSRAEFRILLRQDNADMRLTPKSHALGLADYSRMAAVEKKRKGIKDLDHYLANLSVSPEEANPVLSANESSPLKQKVKIKTLLTRPRLGYDDLLKVSAALRSKNEEGKNLHGRTHWHEIVESLEIAVKYEGYIAKEQEMADRLERLEHIKLYPDFDYSKVNSLSAEAREKLTKIKPETIGQASRISGISPSDVSVLMIHLGR
jgi:tRNA uridine 5-carboxymethylaminomethyl modification enzyme